MSGYKQRKRRVNAVKARESAKNNKQQKGFVIKTPKGWPKGTLITGSK